MVRILSYFKKHILMILILVAVLCVQIRFELLLPEYTSDIVNVGIQQGGLEDSVPKVLDERSYGMILSLSSEENKTKIAKSYEMWAPYKKDSVNMEIGTKNKNASLISDRENGKNYYLLKNGIKTANIENDMINPMIKLAIYSAKSNPNSMNKKMVDVLSQKSIPDYLKKQISIKVVENLYKANGIDVKNIQKKYLWKTGAIMLVVALLIGVLSIVVSFISSRVSSKVSRKVRLDSYKKVLSFSNDEMNKFSIASLIARSTNDIQQIQQSSGLAMKFIFYGPIMAAGAFIKVMKLNGSMVWIIFLAVFMTVASIFILMKKSLPKFKVIQKIVDRLNLVTREFISGIEVNRVFRTSKHEEERFDSVNKNLTDTTLYISRAMSAMQPIMILVMNGASLLIMWIGSKQIDLGHIQVGDMMAFIQYTMQIIMSFLFISMLSIILPRAIVSANRIGEVLDCEVHIQNEDSEVEFTEQGVLEFNNVNFRYEGAEECVLKNISFKTRKGKTTAIIGSTGSGKSTILSLIPRLMDATDGEILLNGVDIKNMPLKLLRNKVSIVTQKPIIFSGTFASNIEYAKAINNLENIKKAAEISQSMDFINKKEDGFQSKIEQGGSNLSGGQKQRLSIARALSRQSEIILFDDCFSALDSRTDRNLRKAIYNELSDKTLIIVAQRINTIVDADEIIVLEKGEIIGRGRHSDLLKNCDVYYEIAKSQLSEEELKNEI